MSRTRLRKFEQSLARSMEELRIYIQEEMQYEKKKKINLRSLPLFLFVLLLPLSQ